MVGLSIFGGGLLLRAQSRALAARNALPGKRVVHRLNEFNITQNVTHGRIMFYTAISRLEKGTITLQNAITAAKPVNNKLWIIPGIGLVAGTGLIIGGSYREESQKEAEQLGGVQAELASINLIEAQSAALVETSTNATDSFDCLISAWNELQTNIKVMADKVKHEDVNNLKVQFEDASIAWQITGAVSDAYKQVEENSSEESIEIDLTEIDTEEEYEEVLKEAYDIDEYIDLSELTEEELTELLLEDFLPEELEEAA